MKHKISILVPAVIEAGKIAKSGQKDVAHTFKQDGSILTHIDTELNGFLCREIAKYFPDANIISEEEDSRFDPGKALTFTVDPIDGTDSYSQGQPGWCIAVGVLDVDMNPIGGLLYAPRWSTPTSCETLIIAEIDEHPTINGEPLAIDMSSQNSPDQSQIMISSTIHNSINIRHYPGKMKYAGCAVLNILAIVMYQRVTCTLVTPLHIWDIAAAHAVLATYGLKLEYLDGEPVSYIDLVNRGKTSSLILAGSTESITATKSYISPVSEC